MSETHVMGIAGAFAILIVITLLEIRRLIPARGTAKFVSLFLCGAAIIESLAWAGIPPWWFAGGKDAFVLGGSLVLGAFVVQRDPGRTFGLPLLAGMGGTLLVLNVLAHV